MPLSTHIVNVGADPSPPSTTSIRGFCTAGAAISNDQIGTLDGGTNGTAVSWASSSTLVAVYVVSNPGGNTMYIQFSGPGSASTTWNSVSINGKTYRRAEGNGSSPSYYQYRYSWPSQNSSLYTETGTDITVEFSSSNGGADTILQSETYTSTISSDHTYKGNFVSGSGQLRTILNVSTNPSSGSATVSNTTNSRNHTVTYTPSATGTYTFTVRSRNQQSVYDSFGQIYNWSTTSTEYFNFEISVVEAPPSADTSISLSQTGSGATVSSTVSASGGTGGTRTYILSSSGTTPTSGDSRWQTSNVYSGLSRNTTYYAWSKLSNSGGSAISARASRLMVYSAPSTLGQILNPVDNGTRIELDTTVSTFLVKFRTMTASSEYRVVGPTGTARDWFTPSGNETNGNGVTSSVPWKGSGSYKLESRRSTSQGGDGSTIVQVDTLSVTIPVTGNLSSTSVVIPGGTISVTGGITNLSFGTNITYSCKRNDTNAQIASGTVTTNEDNESINVNVTAPTGVNTLGFTLSWSGGGFSGSVTSTTTMVNGILTAGTKNAAAGSVIITGSGNYTTIDSWTENSSATTINSGGTLSWLSNEGSADRAATVTARIGISGVYRTISTTAYQVGGATISLSYANSQATAGTVSPTKSGSHSTIAYSVLSGSGATVNASSGVLTWTANGSTSNRSVTIRCTVTRNGDSDTVDVVATQLGGASVTLSYATVNSNVTSQGATTGGTYSSVSYSKISGSSSAGSVNSSTGVVTWTGANTSTADRAINVRATATRNGDTTTMDASATQRGGAGITSFSYSNKNALAGSVDPSINALGSITYSKVSGSSSASLNTSTGRVTWTETNTTADRSITVRATVTRNGGTVTGDATCTQLGGPNVSFSYSTVNTAAGTYSPSASHTGTVGTYTRTGGSSAATINSSTGAVTWSKNESSSSRSATVSVDVTRNGLTKSASATTTQQAGASITSFSYSQATAAGGQILAFTSESSSSVSFAIISGSGASINSSNGTLTWTANEGSSDRSVTVRLTASRNGDTDTADATATQLGGVTISAFSYATKNAAAGNGSTPTFTTSPSSGVTLGNYSVSGTGATVNASTGVLTWTKNPGTGNRSVTVTRTASRNGDTDTGTATATQQGSADITSFSYSNKNAAAGAGSAPSISTAGGSVSYSIPATAYVTINSGTGVLTWTTNESPSNRSVTVTATVSENGTTDAATATATQTGGLTIDSFSYSNKTAAAGAGSAPSVTTNPTSGPSKSYSLVTNTVSASINSSTGVITWPINEGTSNRTVTVRLTSSYNGDTDTFDYNATQLGGASVSLSYASKNAAAGTVGDTTGGTYSSISYSRVSGSSAATVNSSTGIVTWTANTTSSNRSAVIRATASRNGDTDTVDATTTQLAGPGVSGSYTYANALNADGSYVDPAGTPTFTGTAGTWSIQSGKGASINSTNGRVTWTANTGTQRSAIVYRSITNNSYARTLQVGTSTQNAPPVGGNFSLTADDATLLAGQTTEIRALASSLSSGSDFSNRLTITASPSGADNLDSTITGVTDLTGTAGPQHVTTRQPFGPTSVTYSGKLVVSQLSPPDGEGQRIPFPVETRTASVTVNWSAIPVTDFTTNPTWNQGNANTSATASLSTNAIANGLPQGSVSYATKDANQPFTVNSSTGALTWERNPGSTSRTGIVRVTGTNAVHQPGGGSYSEDFTVTQKAGPGVSFSYPVGKNALAGSQPVTAGHTGTATYSVTSGTGATVNSSTGVLTWTKNPGTSDRTVTVTASVTNNGDTRTGTAVATQYGGVSIVSFSYGNKNAAAGSVTPSVDVTPDSVLGFRISQGSGAFVDVNSGVLSWDAREAGTSRTVVVEMTATRNGASVVLEATALQQAGVEIVGFSYPNKAAPAGEVDPAFTTLTSGATVSYSLSSGTGVALNATTGVLTWEANTGTGNRTAEVVVTASNNGDVDTASAIATQTSAAVGVTVLGNTQQNSNELSVVSAVVSGLAPGVTVVSYNWTLVGGSIVSGDGTNQIEIDWSGTTSDIIGTIDLTVIDSLGRSISATTFNVSVTYVDGNPPITGGSGSYGIEFRNPAGQVTLRADEVFTRLKQVGTVPASRTITITGVDSTSKIAVAFDDLTSGPNGFYTVASPTSTTRDITFGSDIPVGAVYNITVAR